MIIGISIVDKHRPEGERHVGTYMLHLPEVSGDSHFELLTIVAPVENEAELLPHCGKLLTKDVMPNPVKVGSDGEPVEEEACAD